MPNSIKNMRAVVGRQSVAGLGLAGLTLLGMASATAQTPMPQATGATTEFKISGFELTGDIPLKSEDTTRVLAPFIGPQGTLLTLQQASSLLLEVGLRGVMRLDEVRPVDAIPVLGTGKTDYKELRKQVLETV